MTGLSVSLPGKYNNRNMVLHSWNRWHEDSYNDIQGSSIQTKHVEKSQGPIKRSDTFELLAVFYTNYTY